MVRRCFTLSGVMRIWQTIPRSPSLRHGSEIIVAKGVLNGSEPMRVSGIGTINHEESHQMSRPEGKPVAGECVAHCPDARGSAERGQVVWPSLYSFRRFFSLVGSRCGIAYVFCPLLDTDNAVLKDVIDEAGHGDVQGFGQMVEALNELIANFWLVHVSLSWRGALTAQGARVGVGRLNTECDWPQIDAPAPYQIRNVVVSFGS